MTVRVLKKVLLIQINTLKMNIVSHMQGGFFKFIKNHRDQQLHFT